MEIRYYGDKITHHIAKTPEGFLICQDVPISRTGYQTYLSSEMFDSPSNGHRAIPVYRPAEEVFDVKSLASFEGKPVTNEHPDEDVKPENYSRYACGHVQNVHVGTGADSNKVLADLYITDPHLIDLIQHGKREISCGYYAEERRDAAGRICQTRIRGNHVAVVRNGRAGKNVCIRDKKPAALCRRKDYGVKGMKKGVRKAVEKAGEVAGAAGHVAKRLGRAGLAGAKAGLSSAAHSLPARAAVRAGKFAGRTAVGAGKLAGKAWLGGVKKVVGTPAKAGLAVAKSAAKNALRGAKPIAKGALKGAKKAVEFAKNSVEKQPAYKVATFAKKHIGKALANSSAARAARREFAKGDSMYWDDELYRDYGVKGMKKGMRKAIKEIGAYAKHRMPISTRAAMERGTAAGVTANKIAGAIGKTKIGSAIANSKLGKSKFGEGAKKVARSGLALGAAFAPIPGMKLVNYHNLRQARKRPGNSAHDSAMYYNLLGGNRMRKRRYLYDEEPFIDDDELLVDELLEDDDYFDEDEFVDSCAKDDDYLEDEDEFVDACKDDDYLEDEDEFEDDDYLEDEDEFEDDDYMEDDDEFVDSDEFEDDDEEFTDDDEILVDEDEFADDDELMADDDELMADDDFEDDDAEEISASAKEVIADAADLLRAARRKHKLGRRKDAIILNDDDLEEDDDEGLIESDADLHDDDYLADDDFEDDEDILADDDDELMADDDEEFTDSDDFEDDDELMADDDEEFADDDIEVTENSESEVLDEDKTRALREITEASRGISDPNERKHLQDAIYNALCNRTQMKDIMRITKKNARSRMDSANTNKNKVNVADQQSIYDSFNPHKKTSF